MNLTELANYYKSDKGTEYKCAHFYTKHYEPLFEQLAKAGEVSLLEIGLNRDDTSEVPSLKMYRDYFGRNARIVGMDIRPEFEQFKSHGFEIVIGDQSNPTDLAAFESDLFSLVIDDGSHASSHQQISLRELWPSVKAGGFYVIEDLHWQPFREECPLTRSLCDEWVKGQIATSQFLSSQWVGKFLSEVKEATLLPSASKLHPDGLTKKALFIAQKK